VEAVLLVGLEGGSNAQNSSKVHSMEGTVPVSLICLFLLDANFKRDSNMLLPESLTGQIDPELQLFEKLPP
jgi:hypothetical protein